MQLLQGFLAGERGIAPIGTFGTQCQSLFDRQMMARQVSHTAIDRAHLSMRVTGNPFGMCHCRLATKKGDASPQIAHRTLGQLIFDIGSRSSEKNNRQRLCQHALLRMSIAAFNAVGSAPCDARRRMVFHHPHTDTHACPLLQLIQTDGMAIINEASGRVQQQMAQMIAANGARHAAAHRWRMRQRGQRG